MSNSPEQGAGKVMRAIRTVISSLTFRCAICMLAYAMVLLGIYACVGTVTEKKLNEARPPMELLQERGEVLANDRFNELVSALPEDCDVLVFASNGRNLYSSSAQAAELVTAADLPVIASSEENLFYEVLERTEDDGSVLIEILLCMIDGDSRAKIVKGSCVCEEDGTIIKGDLFSERDALSERELSLIKGMYDTRKTILKYEYRTVEDAPRTLVMISPVISESTYNSIVAQTEHIWLSAIPFALAATVIAIAVIAYIVRRMTRPLDQAIDARRNASAPEQECVSLPVELVPAYGNFTKLMDQLDNVRDEKQRIITGISHDLKTPLTVISGYSQALIEQRVPHDKQQKYLEAIHDRAGSASQLIDELMDYTTSEHPSFQATLVPCDLYEHMRLLLARWQPNIEGAGDTLQTDIPDGTLVLPLDWHLLERAIDNFLDNACKHNPPGITIRVSCRKDGKKAVISVADTGEGIPEHMRASVFDPFVTSNTARVEGKGTGLGLSIASTFVRLNGGTVRLAEKPCAPFRTEILISFAPAKH